MKKDNAVRLNQMDAYVIGYLLIKDANTKKTSVNLAKSYINSADKMVKCGILKRSLSKYWLRQSITPTLKM